MKRHSSRIPRLLAPHRLVEAPPVPPKGDPPVLLHWWPSVRLLARFGDPLRLLVGANDLWYMSTSSLPPSRLPP
eukprot:8276167-Prorocentrum_lima.AAC.1